MERRAKDGTFYKQVSENEWAPVTRQAKDGTVYKKVGEDNWAPLEPEDPQQETSVGQSALEGFGKGLTMGYLPEIQAATYPAFEAVGEMITGKDLPDETYETRRQENIERQLKQREENPVASYGGEMAGFVVPGMGIAKGVGAAKGAMGLGRAATTLGKAGTLAAEGAAMGAIAKPEGEDSAAQRFENALVGGAFGAALPIAGKALKTGAKAVARGAGTGIRKTVSAIGGVPDENVKLFLKNPKRYLNAPSREETISKVTSLIDDIETGVTDGKLRVNEAKQSVKELERQIRESSMDNKKYIQLSLREAKDKLNETFNQVKATMKSKPAPVSLLPDVQDSIVTLKKELAEQASDAMNVLGDEVVDVSDVYRSAIKSKDVLASQPTDASNAVAKKLKTYVDYIWSKGSTNQKGGFDIKAKDLKQILRFIDEDTGQWSRTIGAQDDTFTKTLKNLRYQLDQQLKSANPKYKSLMEPLAKDAELIGRASKQFGDERRAYSKLSNIGGKSAELDRRVLSELGKRTGKDFDSPINDYLNTQRTLKSQTRMQDIKSGLAENQDIRGLERDLAIANRQNTPKVIRGKVARSAAAKELDLSAKELEKAKQLKDKFAGWSKRSVEDKLNSAMTGKKFVREQLKELGKMGDEDFVEAVDNLRVIESFNKDATRGSRNVNLWSVLSFGGGAAAGGVMGGPVGAAFGAVTGALMDKYGPRATKQLLLATSAIKGRPTVRKLMLENVPKELAEEVIEQLYRTGTQQKVLRDTKKGKKGRALWAEQGFEKLIDSVGREDGIRLYENKDKLSSSQKRQLVELSRLKKNSKAFKDLRDKIIKGIK
jgi:polyhydroxyalkanoate synthesis regulator phasin